MGEARPGLFFPHGSYAYVIQAVTQESDSRLTHCQEWTVDSNRQKKIKFLRWWFRNMVGLRKAMEHVCKKMPKGSVS